ncbi:glycosyltransferase family 1 protein [Algibacter agarivorans]|uniref:Glycosyltransferase family 1 protein n=2 Tax=Algibacter agarivorans TaxID=1109741 RepID=A0ABP9GFR9_9FLAO
MHVFDGKHQGTRTYLKGIYSSLIQKAENHHFFLVAMNIDNLKNEFGVHDNVSYVQLKYHNKFYRLLIELPFLIRKHNIDYAHFQYVSPLFKYCKYIITTHDILFEQKEFKAFFPIKYRVINGLFFRYSAKKADVLLTVSEYSRKKISQIYNIPIDTIHVTPNAVENGFSKLDASVAYPETAKIILYVSRVEPRKNHLILIRAFLELELHKKGYKLVLIGSHDFPGKELQEFIDNNTERLRRSIIWKKDISFESIKHYYANCDLFVFPSFAEGFGIPVIEAMTFNRRIVISNHTAMKDFNLPLEFTFNPFDLEDLKVKIEQALLNKISNQELVYQDIISKYKWDKSANIILNLIS